MKAVKSLSQKIEEGRITSFATLIMLISKPLSHFFCSDYLVLKEGEDQRSQSLYGTMVIPLAQGEALVQQLSFFYCSADRGHKIELIQSMTSKKK